MANKGDGLTMTICEVARALGISRGLCYSLARRDALPVPVIRLGRRMVLSRNAILALLRQSKEEAE